MQRTSEEVTSTSALTPRTVWGASRSPGAGHSRASLRCAGIGYCRMSDVGADDPRVNAKDAKWNESSAKVVQERVARDRCGQIPIRVCIQGSVGSEFGAARRMDDEPMVNVGGGAASTVSAATPRIASVAMTSASVAGPSEGAMEVGDSSGPPSVGTFAAGSPASGRRRFVG